MLFEPAFLKLFMCANPKFQYEQKTPGYFLAKCEKKRKQVTVSFHQLTISEREIQLVHSFINILAASPLGI